MFASLKPYLLRVFAGGWTGRDDDAIDWREGQGPREIAVKRGDMRDLVLIERAELEALRGEVERRRRSASRAVGWELALRAITALPDTVRVTRAKAIAREALGE